MDNSIVKYLDSIEFGKSQTYENMTVVPLMIPDTSALSYQTLGQAQGEGLLSIRNIVDDEYSAELRVENKSNQPSIRPANTKASRLKIAGYEFQHRATKDRRPRSVFMVYDPSFFDSTGHSISGLLGSETTSDRLQLRRRLTYGCILELRSARNGPKSAAAQPD